MFMDLLENHPKFNIQKEVDEKKRNLAFLLLSSVASQSEEDIIDRSMEILKILITQYKLDFTTTDIKGQNVLHKICKTENAYLLNKIIQFMDPKVRKVLINQKNKEQ